ncbi:hypothetical protein XPA_006034 [Xanthoria parietina]
MSEEDDGDQLVTKPFKFVTEQNTVGRTTSTTTSAFSPKAKTLHLVVRYTVK